MKKILAFCLLAGWFSFGTPTTSHAQYKNNKIKVGQEAPNLIFADQNGKDLDLSKIAKGHYVLLDFWASWCRPCRVAHPALVSLYEDYKGKKFSDAPKGFTIVSVSLDKDHDNWVKAIKDDQLTWPYHMSDLKAWSSAAAAAYGVMFIPQSFLIGPDGKIIGVYNHALQAKEELDQHLK